MLKDLTQKNSSSDVSKLFEIEDIVEPSNDTAKLVEPFFGNDRRLGTSVQGVGCASSCGSSGAPA